MILFYKKKKKNSSMFQRNFAYSFQRIINQKLHLPSQKRSANKTIKVDF